MKANHLNFISKGAAFILAVTGGVLTLLGKDVNISTLLAVCGFLMALFVGVDVSMIKSSGKESNKE